MGKATLVDPAFDSGARLLRALDESITISSAFWWLDKETGDWLLVLASPEVDRRGPRHVYRVVQNVLRKTDPSGIDFSDISVVGERDATVRLLSSAVRTGSGVGSVRLQNNVINGVLVEDAYVYRLT